MVALCGAKTRAGHPCRHPAGLRTDHPGFAHCWMHLGRTPSGRAFAAKEAAKAEAARLGVEAPLDAGEGLELAIRLVGGEVAFLREQIRRLTAELEDDDPRQRAVAVHPLASALSGAVDRLAKISKLGVDAGLNERRLALDSMVLERIAGALRAALAEVDLSDRQKEGLRVALTRHLAGLNDLTPRELAA
ncbi:MAG TPA: hypothetical protein VND98_06190 [Solirubrobacterales bacterium]|nr:hypothetical protein [Solirubrobacterales bacterium]